MLTIIALSFSSLAIVAGMFLLAYSRKENLGRLFRIAAWIVVLSGLAGLLCSYAHGFRGMCCKKNCTSGIETCHGKPGPACGMREGCGAVMNHPACGAGYRMGGSGMKCCRKAQCTDSGKNSLQSEMPAESGEPAHVCDEVGCKGYHEHAGAVPAKESSEKPKE